MEKYLVNLTRDQLIKLVLHIEAYACNSMCGAKTDYGLHSDEGQVAEDIWDGIQEIIKHWAD